MMKKTLNNKFLSHLSTAAWRVFGKSIYTECGKNTNRMRKSYVYKRGQS